MSSTPTHAPRLAGAGDALAASRSFCARLTAAQARNFYYGMMLTPGDKRAAMYAIYAWMRAVDDIADADTTGHDDGELKRRALEWFRGRTHAVVQGGVGPGSSEDASEFDAMWPAVEESFRRHALPLRYLDAMIDGQLLDQTQRRYPDFPSLYDYCYKVASVVGLTCIEVWGYEGGEATRGLAEERGVALQLTNILRDLVEDARRDRVYLPADDLARFGFDADSFKRFLLDPRETAGGDAMSRFDALMTFEARRARDYYDRTAMLETHITRTCRPTCWAMMKIYERLLSKIERRPRMVLTRRVKLNKLQKLLIAGRAALRRWLRG